MDQLMPERPLNIVLLMADQWRWGYRYLQAIRNVFGDSNEV